MKLLTIFELHKIVYLLHVIDPLTEQSKYIRLLCVSSAKPFSCTLNILSVHTIDYY